MTVATLTEVLEPAMRHNYAVAGLVVLGWEDARDMSRRPKRPALR